ncbi:MAG TPA: gamma carbonic anhydrase family protein [Bacteroidota bacterium]|jgi:carbonic anhydrase/acetyltransferase-like protein (isoleucine patch superfamily)|nr:gamma carbonic anhydrase family protein [Bacteroidota bacterium]
MIHSYRGVTPNVHPSVFVVASAQIIGDVVIGKDSSVWYNAVIRGDVNSIRIGERTNVQDCCVLHVRHKEFPLLIGSNVTLGHGAIVHACTIHDYCLIGMGAIVLDNAIINSYTLVAAGAVVLSGMNVPEGVLVAGVPAKVVRPLTVQERRMLEESAANYVEYATTYREPQSQSK